MRRTVGRVTQLGVFCIVLPVALAQTPSFPEGNYISVDSRDPLAVTRNAGVVFIFQKGVYEIRRDNEPRVRGTYKVDADRITLTDGEGPWACTDPAMASATYRWRLADGQLALALVDQDPCNRRRNRLAGAALVAGQPPPPAKTIAAPASLQKRWDRFWRQSDAKGWIDDVFDSKAVAEDGNRKLSGIEEIRQWLGGQDSRKPEAFPFDFAVSEHQVIEKGRYRDIFGAPDGSTPILVGRYQLTWTRNAGADWKVAEWILR